MSARIRSWLVLAFAAPLLGGCQLDWVREHPLDCRADEKALVRDTLYFGRSIPGGGDVDDTAWRRFESETLLPSFPRGYTMLDGHGHWRGADGAIIGEENRIVIVVHSDDAASASVVRDVVARYRSIFHQESVLRERTAVCAEF